MNAIDGKSLGIGCPLQVLDVDRGDFYIHPVEAVYPTCILVMKTMFFFLVVNTIRMSKQH